MKKKGFVLLFLLLSLISAAQFNQKVSLSVSAGIFKTFGEKYGGNFPVSYLPRQMPWYKAGIAGDAGFQFNITRHFSLRSEIGILYSWKWECISSDDYNWMSYELYAADGETLLSAGTNKMQLLNLSLSMTPMLYLMPDKKLNPFLYAGISINLTRAPYENNYWKDYLSNGLFMPGDEEDWSYLEKNTGLGVNPGIGLEYRLNNQIGLSLTTGYYLVFIKQDKYPYDYRELIDGNLGAFQLRAGLRINFIKIKEL